MSEIKKKKISDDLIKELINRNVAQKEALEKILKGIDKKEKSKR